MESPDAWTFSTPTRRYKITMTTTVGLNYPTVLESWATLGAAEVALKIVNDHEENNGRGPGYWTNVDAKPSERGE